MTELTNAGRSRLLHSWKEIAGHLGLGVRTAQRYEAQFGLPVHRAAAKPRSSVAAFTDELDAWLRQTSVRRRHEVPDGGLCPLCSGTGRLLPLGTESRLTPPEREQSERQQLAVNYTDPSCVGMTE